MMKTTAALCLALVSMLGSCTAQLGEACDEDGQCATGLRCVSKEEQIPDDAGELQCVAQTLCSVPCVVDGDCTDQGDGIICVIDDCGAGACLVGSRG